MRFTRDRRGYETTTLVEAGGRRRRGQRILYFFRTPPSVRVGREAIDAEAMRLLEEHNPEVTFDWQRLLKAAAVDSAAPPASAAGWRRPSGTTGAGGWRSKDERRPDRRDHGRPRPPRLPTPDVPAASATAADEAEHTHFEGPDAPAPEGAPLEAIGAVEPAEPSERLEPFEALVGPEPSADVLPLTEPAQPPFTGDEPEPVEPVQLAAAVDAAAPTDADGPAAMIIGPDGVRRLRARYADVVARLEPGQEASQAEREELLARAARLDPDGWKSDAAVRAALEEYETVFESLRPFLGRPPRRRRP